MAELGLGPAPEPGFPEARGFRTGGLPILDTNTRIRSQPS
jgi:hypothetical protein